MLHRGCEDDLGRRRALLWEGREIFAFPPVSGSKEEDAKRSPRKETASTELWNEGSVSVWASLTF